MVNIVYLGALKFKDYLKICFVIIIIIIIIKFFTSAIAMSLSHETGWQQASFSLLDSSQCSGWSQQCYLNNLDSSSDFQFFLSNFQVFEDRSKCTNYSWHYPHVPLLLKNFLARFLYLSLFSFYSIFTMSSAGTARSITRQLHFFVNDHLVRCSGRDYVIRLYLKVPENFTSLILQDGLWFMYIPFDSTVKFQFLA